MLWPPAIGIHIHDPNKKVWLSEDFGASWKDSQTGGWTLFARTRGGTSTLFVEGERAPRRTTISETDDIARKGRYILAAKKPAFSRLK